MRADEPPALLSLACMFGEALKTKEQERYDSKIEISVIGVSDTPLPPPPQKNKVLKVYLKFSLY